MAVLTRQERLALTLLAAALIAGGLARSWRAWRAARAAQPDDRPAAATAPAR